jgi:histidine ammonia-lyase
VQDPYSLRCIPQVLGPAVEALSFLKAKLEIEVNASTDNPLVFADGQVLSGGNFHGEILGLALEMATIALAEVGAIAERRIDRLLTSPGRGLPLFLAREAGLHSGLMLTQYTAASLVSENKILSHPALVDSIPTSGGKEDHNSLASISARKALTVLDNLERVIAIEFLCAAQALDFRQRDKMAQKTRKAYERVRELVSSVDGDRPPAPDIERLARAVARGEIIDALV